MHSHLHRLWTMSGLFLFLGLAACGVSPGEQSNTPLHNLVQLIRQAGATKVEEQGSVTQPFFTAPGNIVVVGSQQLQVYTYVNETEMRADIKHISPQGDIIGNSIVDWTAPPHFYQNQKGWQIVLYVGSDPSTIHILEKALGSQFAGAPL